MVSFDGVCHGSLDAFCAQATEGTAEKNALRAKPVIASRRASIVTLSCIAQEYYRIMHVIQFIVMVKLCDLGPATAERSGRLITDSRTSHASLQGLPTSVRMRRTTSTTMSGRSSLS